MVLLALITKQDVIAKILTHVKVPRELVQSDDAPAVLFVYLLTMGTIRLRLCAPICGLLAVFANTGCSLGATDPRTFQIQQPLSPGFSAPFDVEPYPAMVDEPGFWGGLLACGTAQCLVSYSKSVQGSPAVLASRLAHDGTATDLPRLRLSDASGVFYSAAKGDEFLVGTLDFTTAVQVFRVQGSSGAVDEVTTQLPSGTFNAGGSSAHWLVAHGSSADTYASVLDGAFTPVAAPTHLPAAVPADARIVAGDQQFLIVWPGNALRIDEATGMLLDSAPIAFSQYNQGDTHGVFKNGVYQLAWLMDHSGYGSRIRASDGAVLDPDDVFNQISGAKLLCQNCSVDQTNVSFMGTLHVGDIGSSVLVTWTHMPNYAGPWVLYGARVDVATGTRSDGITNVAEAMGGNLGRGHQLYINESWGNAVDADGPAVDQQRSVGPICSPFRLILEWDRFRDSRRWNTGHVGFG